MHTLLNIFHFGVKELRSLGRNTMMLIIIAIVDEDRSQLSQRIVNAFYPPRFLVPAIIDPSATDSGMDVGLYTFVLDIPPDFQRDVLAGRQPRIQVNVDATRMKQAFVQHHRADAILPVEPEVRVLFNPNLSNVWFGSVMELINSITALSLVFVMQGWLEVPIQGSMALFVLGMALHLFAPRRSASFWAPWRARCRNWDC